MPLIRNITAALVIATTSSPAISQVGSAFDGLYFPDGSTGWTCNPDHIGLDGGALGIGGGYLDGLENRCELTNPQPALGDGTSFTALCSAEGETYADVVTITKTGAGVRINRNGASVAWNACPTSSAASTDAVVQQGRWVFADGVASIRTGDSFLEFSCLPAGAASTIPTARMYACPLCWQGDEIAFGLRVDGGPIGMFTFTKQSNAEGMTSDLYGSPAWHDGIIPQLMSGRELTVFEGNVIIATYPLNGSSAALAALQDKCN